MAYRQAIEYAISTLAIGSALALIIYAVSTTNVTRTAPNGGIVNYRSTASNLPSNLVVDGSEITYNDTHNSSESPNSSSIINVITIPLIPSPSIASGELRRGDSASSRLSNRSRLRSRSHAPRSLRLQRRNFTWEDADLLGTATFSAFHDPDVVQVFFINISSSRSN